MVAALRKSNIREPREELISISCDVYRVIDALRALTPATMAGAMIYVATAALEAETRRQADGHDRSGIADLAVDALIRLDGEGAQ